MTTGERSVLCAIDTISFLHPVALSEIVKMHDQVMTPKQVRNRLNALERYGFVRIGLRGGEKVYSVSDEGRSAMFRWKG